ncbi:lipocalin-15 [Neophocaena asiaeorientalis asiaeorientalis]|uniref:Lipocalin-15 n=1 Tax=Neophocaena asiaeorientalis asiaeorientalis TaxID=1706337 RepID=A0A341CX01_NEOAA|nr:lipocalin-15 [Neophocaena asiaeorientalis asiaeorientalis]XP_024618397.1 lipocalin-15 [Neophocaena asiaeorientalis asiaeorientalis]XP_024618398.1 lipocalin-15 [Neophocaena asiaeorientalis asiaeorientalis]
MVSDCKVFRDKKDHLLTSTSNVKATAEGSLSVHMQLPGWTQEASPQALKAFQDFYPTVGLAGGHGGHAAQVRYPPSPVLWETPPTKPSPAPFPESWEAQAGGGLLF